MEMRKWKLLLYPCCVMVLSAHLWKLGVSFVDGVRCSVNSMSQLLLQKPIRLCSLTYPVIRQSTCHRVRFMIRALCVERAD